MSRDGCCRICAFAHRSHSGFHPRLGLFGRSDHRAAGHLAGAVTDPWRGYDYVSRPCGWRSHGSARQDRSDRHHRDLDSWRGYGGLARIGLLVRNTLGNAQIVERLKINMVDVDSAEASANVRGSYLLVAPK